MQLEARAKLSFTAESLQPRLSNTLEKRHQDQRCRCYTAATALGRRVCLETTRRHRLAFGRAAPSSGAVRGVFGTF